MAAPIVPPKAGIKTTEFWLTLATALAGIGGQVAEVLPEPWGLILAAVVTAIYTVTRGVTKVK